MQLFLVVDRMMFGDCEEVQGDEAVKRIAEIHMGRAEDAVELFLGCGVQRHDESDARELNEAVEDDRVRRGELPGGIMDVAGQRQEEHHGIQQEMGSMRTDALGFRVGVGERRRLVGEAPQNTQNDEP